MAVHLIEPRGMPTMFGEVYENNVAFCVDTSGSMYRGLEVVKEHLMETLMKHGSKSKPTMFNIIEFNSEVTQWSDKMVTCTPQTVAVAKDWINKLSAKTGTNTKDALLTALTDPRCDAVYLVTDGLPDHHPVEILDHVGNIGKTRPVHCIYLSTEETTESSAIEFLEDLAIETYGSFHIVTLTTHGCVERVTPIYRAEHAQERIVRTLNGTIRPSSAKTCSVATTLQVDPDESLYMTPRVSNVYPNPPYYSAPWFNWMGLPHRYYFPNAWARYRPARGWFKAQEQMTETAETSGLSPAAGALLINKKILARRIDDGYFYLGTVKSQILSDKFLVAFGPCKHGRYKDTIFQDTNVYDIIDYEDAKRHTILTGDKVLAPWEPEGEKYGPGTVIEGHEKRQAEGRYSVAIAQGPDDKEIVVSFTNGKVEKVPRETAMWIPLEVSERLALELKMPKQAREALSTEENYPSESFDGYPTSGMTATPDHYELANPVYMDYEPVLVDGMPWRPQHSPHHPMFFRRGKPEKVTARSEVKSEDINALIPGTDMTQKELDEKVLSQLVEHKLVIDEKENEKGTKKSETEEEIVEKRRVMELERRLMQRRRETEQQLRREMEQELRQELEQEQQQRLLMKREKQEENTLKKSVTFSEDFSSSSSSKDIKVEDLEETKEEHKERMQAAAEEELERGYTPYFRGNTEIPFDETINQRERGVNTDSCLLYPKPAKLVSRPQWKKYWRADPSMPTRSISQGPFRETALQAPLEARSQQHNPYITEWTSPAYQYVDPLARNNYTDSVDKLLTQPTPPMKPDRPIPPPQPPRPVSADSKEAARRDYKRRMVIQRGSNWNNKLQHQDNMQELMNDQHRERIQSQLDRERHRQITEQRMVEQAREVKKHLSKELREKVETGQKREQDREQQRIDSMARRRERREAIQGQREKFIEDTTQRRNEIKAQRSQHRWDQVEQRLDSEETENARKSEQHQQAKMNRIEHFQRLEEEGQRRKDLRVGVNNWHQSMFQSSVLP